MPPCPKLGFQFINILAKHVIWEIESKIYILIKCLAKHQSCCFLERFCESQGESSPCGLEPEFKFQSNAKKT